jgi:hypothetical protein
MSDVMLYGILNMPYEMAMNDELSRFQFYQTVQQLLEKDSQQQAEIEALKQSKFDANNKVNLTDEEIIEVHINTPFIDGYLNKNLIDFARAILRKAQEK